MVGSYSFEKNGEKNPYDEYKMYAEAVKDTQRFAVQYKELGQSTDIFFRALTAAKMYLHKREEDGKEVNQVNFSANFNTFYTTLGTSVEHYTALFHILWAGGYSLEDMEGFATVQAENVVEENQNDFIDVANEGMRLFLKELQG